MSRGINKVIIIGTVGKDPETKPAQSTAITTLSLATSESWKDKQTGEKVEKTEWHNIVMYGKLAEITNMYVRKGAKLYIEGKLKTDKWDDKTTGKIMYKTSIVANEMQIVSNKEKTEEHVEKDVQWANNNTNNLSSNLKDDDIPF